MTLKNKMNKISAVNFEFIGLFKLCYLKRKNAFFIYRIKILSINDGISKIITQVLVIIINYVFSKLIVFKDEEDKNEED